ncbi:MAG: hypothetical protein KFF50_11355 [Desulfatitalea sp.]|nr:hypothetical protein [Desulfatitalea sp.]
MTIIISSILAVLIAQVVSGQTWRSYRPLLIMEQNLALRTVMEEIIADYRELRKNESSPVLDTLITRINSGGYWIDKPFLPAGIAIQAEHRDICFGLDDGLETVSCTNSPHPPVLKLSLMIQGTQHQLTALFGP